MRRFKSLHLAMLTLGSLCLNSAYASDTLHSLSDSEMSATTGQSLFTLQYLAPGDTGNTYTASTGNIGFYTLGMEAEVSLNANIKTMQLGCGGVNGDGACDIDAQNVSFGCITNSAGACITLPKTYASQPNGTAKNNADVLTEAQENSGNIRKSMNDSSTVNSPASGNVTQSQMKNFVLDNPFFQFAIKNPNSASTREVAGFRIGAQSVSGPLSFGNLTTFSGYLTGSLDLIMGGGTDVAATCPHPNIGGAAGGCNAAGASTTGRVNNGYSNFGSPYASTSYGVTCLFGCDRAGTPAQNGNMTNPTTAQGGYLYLGDDEVADVLGIKVRYQQLTMNYQTVSRLGNAVVLNGNRQTQAQISGVNLAGVVNSLIYGNTNGSTTVGANPLTTNRIDSTVPNGLVEALLPLLRDGVADGVKRQLAQGLRLYNADATANQTAINARSATQIHTDLNNYVMPFNLNNFHQVEVDSNVFGLSVQGQALQYPGYAAPVTKGWAMYVPDAFKLIVDQPTTALMSGITGTSAARDGNITLLAPSYRNCYGNLKFC